MDPEFDEEGRNYWNHGVFNKLLSQGPCVSFGFPPRVGLLAIVESQGVTVTSKSMRLSPKLTQTVKTLFAVR
jgi:hypothetical protein